MWTTEKADVLRMLSNLGVQLPGRRARADTRVEGEAGKG